jgi:hypothetical protein
MGYSFIGWIIKDIYLHYVVYFLNILTMFMLAAMNVGNRDTT